MRQLETGDAVGLPIAVRVMGEDMATLQTSAAEHQGDSSSAYLKPRVFATVGVRIGSMSSSPSIPTELTWPASPTGTWLKLQRAESMARR